MDYNKMSYEELVEQLKGNYLLLNIVKAKENFIKYSENICKIESVLLKRNNDYFNKHFIEVWRDIKGYEGLYQISNWGRVKSLPRKYAQKTEKILKNCKNGSGYYLVVLNKNGESKNHHIHRLVAEAFIHNPDNLPIINHKNGNKLNNSVENLEWCTYSHNTLESYRLNPRETYSPSRGKFGKDHHNSKKVLQYDLNGNFIREWECAREIQRRLNIHVGNISSCLNGKRKTTGGYIWKFKEE